jgi:hypothetical protein
VRPTTREIPKLHANGWRRQGNPSSCCARGELELRATTPPPISPL